MPDFENQKKYWDTVADKKEFTTPFQFDLFEKHVSKDSHILDVGCGYGRTLAELYKRGYRNLTGLDFSEKMIERGTRLHPFLHLEKMERKDLPLKDASVDAVILLAVLTCITDDSEQTYLIGEIKRVLKPFGVLYINDFLINTDERNVTRYKTYEKRYGAYGIFELPEGALLRHYEESRIKVLTNDFDTVFFQKTVYTTMNKNTSNGFCYIGKVKL